MRLHGPGATRTRDLLLRSVRPSANPASERWKLNNLGLRRRASASPCDLGLSQLLAQAPTGFKVAPGACGRATCPASIPPRYKPKRISGSGSVLTRYPAVSQWTTCISLLHAITGREALVEFVITLAHLVLRMAALWHINCQTLRRPTTRPSPLVRPRLYNHLDGRTMRTWRDWRNRGSGCRRRLHNPARTDQRIRVWRYNQVDLAGASSAPA